MDIVVSPALIGANTLQTVNARDLHARLGVRKDFSAWIKVQLRDFFAQDVDFSVFTLKGENSARPLVEYALTLECAKHIALMSRTEQGRAIRDYFITLERKLLESSVTPAAQTGTLERIVAGGTSFGGVETAFFALIVAKKTLKLFQDEEAQAAALREEAQAIVEQRAAEFDQVSRSHVYAVSRSLSVCRESAGFSDAAQRVRTDLYLGA